MNPPRDREADSPDGVAFSRLRPAERRWLWVAGLTLVALVALFAWNARAPSRSERWMKDARQRGERLTFAELGIPLIDSKDNAREAVEIAAGRLSPLLNLAGASNAPAPPSFPGLERVATAEPFLPSPSGQALPWAEGERGVDAAEAKLAALRRALDPPPEGRWNYTNFTARIDYVAVRQGAQSLTVAVLVDLRREHLPAALDNLIALIRLGQFSRGIHTLVSLMIRTAITQLAIEATWQALQAPGWNDAQLAQIQSAFEQTSLLPGFVKSLEVERALGLWYYSEFRKQGPSFYPRVGIPGSSVSLGDRFRFAAWRSFWADSDLLSYLEGQQAVLDTFRGLLRQDADLGMHLAMLREGPDQAAPSESWFGAEHLFARVASANCWRAAQVLGNTEARRRLVIVAVAAERFRLARGHWPARAEDLVPEFLAAVPIDPYSVHPLRLVDRGDQQPLLYSVGRDGRDDGGDPQPAVWWKTYRGPEDGRDLVWPSAAAPAQATAPAVAETTIPVVQLEGALLGPVIDALSRQAGLEVSTDPAIAPLLNEPVDYRAENVSAQAALKAVLSPRGLRLVEHPWTNRVGITR